MILLKIPILALWLALIAALILVVVEVYFRDFRKSYPGFSLYIYVALAKCLAIFATFYFFYGYPYVIAYYAGTVVHAAMVAVVGIELYLKTFGTRVAVPSWVPRKTFHLVLAMIAVSVVLALAIKAKNGGRITQAMVTCEQMLVLGSLLSLLAMAAFSKRLGITWNKTAAEIWLGFVLFLLVDSITAYVRGSGSVAHAGVAVRVGTLSYILALAWWRWRLFSPLRERNTAKLSYHRGRQ